jgi:hypothetical protein
MTDTLELANDPQQAAVDAAVAAAVASNPDILTPAKSGEAVAASAFGAAPADPSERLRLALSRRAAFRAAVARLRPYRADTASIVEAIQAVDSDDIRLAICAHATGAFLDSELGRADTFLHGLNATLEQEVLNAVYAAPERILATFQDDSSPDAVYIKRLALEATTLDQHLFDIQGQATRPKVPVLSMFQTLVPR